MPIRRGLFAVICLAVSTPAAFAQTATTTSGQISAYAIDGLALGERVQSNNSGYREYKCRPRINSVDLRGVKRRASRRSGEGLSTSQTRFCTRVTGKLFTSAVTKARAFFGPNEADEDIQRHSLRMGEAERRIKMPRRPRVPDGVLAAWGKIALEPLDGESIAALGKGRSPSRKGHFVDFIGNFARSAKNGLPIYRVSGGAGFLSVASFDQKGRGTLRLAAVDAAARYR